ncbi:hypothetical protein [Flavobacterium sp. 5]|uniref:Ig-like domain-containing protein n=1 Tax=Flavobacterium sp. 5 TaxID=2035199 RepID=UPI000C2C0130|nr:hypothetical protein [Flavobacterium sp. 5]PKB16500.1 hypothetical protein CLU82_1638 [Flavobacterium sp. 5]
MDKFYLNSKKNAVLSLQSSRTIRLLLMVLFVCLFGNTVFGQSVGDYRSKATGNWTSLSSWEYYNGSSWITPTATQGYPGEKSGTGAVLIQTGHIITINATITTFPFGTLTITGRLVLQGDTSSGGMDFYLTTQAIIVTPSSGFMEFNDKVNLRLPSNSSLQVTSGGLDNGSGCSANQIIYIGATAYSKCNGGGSTLPNFSDLMNSGGTLNPIVTSNSPVCINNTVNLLGSFSGVSGTTTSGGATSGVNYSWSIVAPDASTQTSSLQNYSFTASQIGSYSVTLTCTTYFNTTLFSNAKIVTVIVSALPSAPTVSKVQPTCTVATGSISILTPAPDGVLKYSIDGLDYTNTLGVFNSLSSGTYSVTVKNSSGCISSATSAVINAQPVTPAVPIISAGGSTTFCTGGSVTLTSSVGNSYLWSTGATSLSIAPSTAGSYTVKVTNASGCQSASSLATVVTVTAPPTAPTGLASQSFCSGASPTVANLSATGSGILWYLAPSGGTSLTISTALINGNHYYASQTASGCESTSRLDVSVILNSAPNAPVVPSTLNLSCAATSFVVNWTASANTTKYRLDVATDTGFTNIVSPYGDLDLGNIVSTTVTGLPTATAFYLRLRAENVCGVGPNSIITTVSLPITKTMNGTTWDNGLPDNTKKAVFMSGGTLVPITSKLTACSCQIGANIAVKVGVPNGANTDAILNLVNGLDVDPTSTLTFENNASLVQINDNAVNTGKINYVRNTSPVQNFDYVYWCSPVKDQVLNVFSPASDRYYSYANGAWVPEAGTNKMNPMGKGFIIRVPKLYTNTSQTFTFKGVPNNGEVWVDVVTVKSNLIGNPYASALDADLFMTNNNNKDIINSALYFWTHNTQRTLVGSQYVYTSNDYAVYNLTGGAGPAPSTSGLGVTPSGQIAAGQAFFVASSVVGKFYFNNLMRISDSAANSQFFKPSKTKKGAGIEKNRIWLDLTNDGGAFKQLLVGYITGATNEFDKLYDGFSLNGNTFVDFYSVNDSKNYTIQGRKLPFNEADVVPLGYNTTVAGTFKISINKVDGSLTNQAVYLEDKVTNSIYNLKSGAYIFTTEIGTFNNRFVLRYANSTSKLGVTDDVVKEKGVVISVKNHQIKINSFDQAISAVKVYDLKGSLLYEKNKVDLNEFIVDHLASSDQFLIVMTQLENNKWVSEEIIFQD